MGAGAGVVMTSPSGETFEYNVHFGFKASNNEVEYEVAIAGICLSIVAGTKRIIMLMDLWLVYLAR